MPTVRWKPRASSPHYYFRSLERFHMVQILRDLELILMFFVLEMSDDSSGGITLPLLTMMTMFSVEDDLRRIRPSNFYPPAGFYPRGSNDSFWDDHSDHFFKKFRSGFLISVQGYAVGRQGFHLWHRQEPGSCSFLLHGSSSPLGLSMQIL